jgi:hypothetical protein
MIRKEDEDIKEIVPDSKRKDLAKKIIRYKEKHEKSLRAEK